METNDQLDRWVGDRMSSLRSEWNPNSAAAFAQLKNERALRTARQRSRVWAAGTAAVVLAAAVAMPGTRALATQCVGACGAAGVRLWQRFAPVDSGDQKLAPDFSLRDVNGHSVRLSDFRGKVVLLNFWATWCPPCKVEIPWFAEFQRAYADRGLVVLGVSLDENGWAAVKPFLEANNVAYPVLVDDADVAARYGGVDSLPTTFIINRAGGIVSTHAGLAGKSTYRAEIEAQLGR